MICGLLKANCIPTLAKLWESTQQNQEDAEEWKDDHAKIVLKCGRTTDTQELLYFSSTAFLRARLHTFFGGPQEKSDMISPPFLMAIKCSVVASREEVLSWVSVFSVFVLIQAN